MPNDRNDSIRIPVNDYADTVIEALEENKESLGNNILLIKP